MRLPTIAILLLTAVTLTFGVALGCGGKGGSGAGTSGSNTLTIYSGRSESMIEDLIQRFEEETGITVQVTYDRTPNVATTLRQEGAQTPADVFFAQDPGYLGSLAEDGMLAELPEELFELVDEHMCDENRRWIGTSGRLRVLTYNPSLIEESELPQRLEELAEPRYDSMAWAPQNGSLQAHLSALRHHWGEEKTRDFVLKLNEKRATTFQSNRPSVSAVAKGDVAFTWTNHYYRHALGGDVHAKTRNYSFPESQDAGNVMMVAGAGILKSSRNQEAAQKFIEFLLSEESQVFFAQQNFEYPTRRGVKTHPDVTPLEEISLLDVPQAAMAEVSATARMLQQLGIQ